MKGNSKSIMGNEISSKPSNVSGPGQINKVVFGMWHEQWKQNGSEYRSRLPGLTSPPRTLRSSSNICYGLVLQLGKVCVMQKLEHRSHMSANFILIFFIIVINMKFTILVIVSIQFYSIKYIHIIVKCISRTFASCTSETLYPLNKGDRVTLFTLPPAPGTNH